ncbi:glycosyltransferase family 2 protein [Pollutibacter soli]|uniref:glycosyltransferase family 2 protein n=1 Tax=Pollutibacter soli TaxID=3034157 RepID=UPI0030137562
MLISIVTPTYNSAETVKDTLSSVAMQKGVEVEHIIVDGLSKDNTIELVKSFPHVARVDSEKDGGIYDAMNKGIRRANGDIVGILNSDDLYAHPDVLRKVAELFEDESIDAVYADLEYVERENTNKVVRYWRSGKYNTNQFYYGWMPPHPTFFIRRHFYEKFGEFNCKLRSAADYELMLRFLLKHKLKPAYLPEVIVKMRTGGMSNASFSNRLKANREDREAWRMNAIQPFFFTLFLKPFRKILQYVNR